MVSQDLRQISIEKILKEFLVRKSKIAEHEHANKVHAIKHES